MSRSAGCALREPGIDDRDRVLVDRGEQRVDVVHDLDRAQRRADEPLQRALRLALGVRDDELPGGIEDGCTAPVCRTRSRCPGRRGAVVNQ